MSNIISSTSSSTMTILGRVSVQPRLPAALNRLPELAGNLFWTWDSATQALFRQLDPALFEQVNGNPVQLLLRISSSALEVAAGRPEFLSALNAALTVFDRYLQETDGTWFAEHGKSDDTYAYFCAEYGWHESLPLYSGGLGILAGDHTKAASDLGVPLVGIGLWYGEGYFHQRISADGQQQAVYQRTSPAELPFERVVAADGSDVRVEVSLFGRTVRLAAWRVAVGRNSVYLLDSDVPENEPDDRLILQRLYGGDQRTRIAQEVVLGIGGVRLLRKLGVAPDAWHMNEGHSAFMALERCRELVNQGLTFSAAREAVAASTLFTVHTPVPAGNDAFDFALAEECFAGYWTELGLEREEFLALAKADHGWGDLFSMPALAFRFSSGRNGVSQLHGDTTRRMWAPLWPGVPADEIPIRHITNGVHLQTWMDPEMQALLDGALPPRWQEQEAGSGTWQAVNDLPAADFQQARAGMKQRSLEFMRERAVRQLQRRHAPATELQAAAELFDSRNLTIGFARRFATYKRATLIFSDLDRLEQLLNHPERPVQLVFAGKAHPADEPGQLFIERIQQLSRDPRFARRILFLEDYDMALGRMLTAGVDVWLNNPRRPLEASGTSGEKAAMNGVLNLSVLDGWWPEGYDGHNGWAFGWTDPYDEDSTARVDESDAAELYDLLENEVVPLYYQRDSTGLARGWLQRSQAAVASITPRFNARRMVRDYATRLYAPAAARAREFAAGDFVLASELAQWKGGLQGTWPAVQLTASVTGPSELTAGDRLSVTARLTGPAPKPKDALRVELVYGVETDGKLQDQRVVQLTPTGPDRGEGQSGSREFSADFNVELTGRLAYAVRAYPLNDSLASQFDSGFITWAASGADS